MKIALVNESTDVRITSELLARIASAVEYQLCQHYVPMWEAAPSYCYATQKPADSDCMLVVRDNSEVKGALGDHYTVSGRPIGEVLVAPIMANGGTLIDGPSALSVTVSHEVLEMLGDPYCQWWRDMNDGVTQDAMELCDRVEGDCYEIEGIAVSDFLGPRAFSSGAGPYDYMGLLNHAEDIRHNGYAIRRVGKVISTPWGRSYPEWRKETKARKIGRRS